MASIGIGIPSLIMTICVILYGMAVAFQSLYLVIESVLRAKIPKNFSFSYFCENVGILCAVIGYPFGITGLVCVGALLIALRVALSFRTSTELHPMIEVPLLVSALLTLGSVLILKHIQLLSSALALGGA